MLEIIVAGNVQGGKTTQLIELANRFAGDGKDVIYAVQTERYAKDLKNSREIDSRVTVCGAGQFLRLAMGRAPFVIILDEVLSFPASKDGSYLAIARSRLKFHHFSVLAYSAEEKPVSKWISTVTWWKPWTWGSGYWEVA